MTHDDKSGKQRDDDLREQVQRLQEELRKAQGAAAGTPAAQADGLAEGIASALGRLVPGFGKLIDAASAMPEFHQRLAAIDEEVKRKFKDQPLRRASVTLGGASSRRQMGIPPSIRRGQGGQVGSTNAAAGKPRPTHGHSRRARNPRVHISPETPAQLAVDVFDEGRKIVVLAEAPGLELRDVNVSLDETVLLIAIDAPHRQGIQRIELPCKVVGKPKVSLANGILSIQVNKASGQ